jgi:hypothetical protein
MSECGEEMEGYGQGKQKVLGVTCPLATQFISNPTCVALRSNLGLKGEEPELCHGTQSVITTAFTPTKSMIRLHLNNCPVLHGHTIISLVTTVALGPLPLRGPVFFLPSVPRTLFHLLHFSLLEQHPDLVIGKSL